MKSANGKSWVRNLQPTNKHTAVAVTRITPRSFFRLEVCERYNVHIIWPKWSKHPLVGNAQKLYANDRITAIGKKDIIPIKPRKRKKYVKERLVPIHVYRHDTRGKYPRPQVLERSGDTFRRTNPSAQTTDLKSWFETAMAVWSYFTTYDL